jgi:hypothetical protein
MARKINARTVANKRALDAITRGLVDGMADLGRTILHDTRPPDEPPLGKGLVATGDWGVWNGTRKVDGTATKPKTVRLERNGGITLIVGYGFPGRFNELGTINQPARPFLTPAVLEEIPSTEDHLKAPVRRALAEVR